MPDAQDRSEPGADDTDHGQHGTLEERLARTVEPVIAAMGYELVRVQVSGTKRPTVQVMADRADGALIGVGDCERISHAVGAVFDVEDPFTGEWNLEVSSAGIDRPLTRTKDWVRYAGHLAMAELHVPRDGRRRYKGLILRAGDDTVRLRLEEGGEVELTRPEIRRAKLVMTDALIAATAAGAATAHDRAGDEGDDTSPPSPAH